VVVLRAEWTDAPPHHQVVVGLKSHRHSAELLSQAFAEAVARDARLVVVMAWELSDPYADRVELRTHAPEWETEGRQMVAELTADWRTAYPDVPVDTRVVHGRPAQVLLHESAESDLLIVSRRRLSLPPYGHLGAIVHSLLQLSVVPVQVVPYAPDPPAADEELVLEAAGMPLK